MVYFFATQFVFGFGSLAWLLLSVWRWWPLISESSVNIPQGEFRLRMVQGMMCALFCLWWFLVALGVLISRVATTA